MEIKATNFYVEPTAINGERLSLDETESHHLAKVMRAKPGDIFYAIDGTGKKYQASVEIISPKDCLARILDITKNENEPVCKITLACGLCRASKADFIIEKGTELGINKFCFFVSDNTLANDLKESAAAKKVSRWQKLALSAAKQSLRTVIPSILPPLKFPDILKMASEYQLSLMADFGEASASLSQLLLPKPETILLIVGPEAGFSQKESESAQERGFKIANLGPRRLRAETAAITFSALVLSHLGEI